MDEEEAAKLLFVACDKDRDGFVTRQVQVHLRLQPFWVGFPIDTYI